MRAARLSILAEREAQLGILKEDAQKRLGRLVQSDKYSSLLESLIVEVRARARRRARGRRAARPRARGGGVRGTHAARARERGAGLQCTRSARADAQPTRRPRRPSAQGLIRLEGGACAVKGVSGQANLIKNVLPSAVNKYKAWAEKEKGAQFVKEIDVTFDSDAVKNSCVARHAMRACAPR